MKYPRCFDSYHPQTDSHQLGRDKASRMVVIWQTCPGCGRVVIELGSARANGMINSKWIVHPRGTSRSPLSADVDDPFAQDYTEACQVISDSPKASAALGRRCLQNIIREKAGITKRNLNDEIDALLESGTLPSYLADSVDAVRTIGNFAAHPVKSTNTGEVVDVEPGEAEWILDVLEGLFDLYFIQPAELERKREQLNKKLEDAGKPRRKGSQG